MNSFKILFFSLMLTTVSATAQYGNVYGNGMRSNRLPENHTTDSKPSPEDIEKEKSERIVKVMDRLKTELTLDELQYIAIKNEITSSNRSIEIVMKSENSDEDKNNEIKAIKEKTDKTIISYLNASQKEKYQKMKEDRALGKEEKKKKKRKEEEKE